MFRQKGAGVPRGNESVAEDAVPSELSGGEVRVPIWKSFVGNKDFQERQAGAIAAEKSLMASAGRGGVRWGGDNGRLFRKAGSSIEEFDAEQLAEDPEAGPFARKSLFDRERRSAAAEYDGYDLKLQDPAFKARGLTEKDRQERQFEFEALPDTDPRKAQAKAAIDADDQYRAEKAEIEQRKYNAKVRATQLGNIDPDTWWANRATIGQARKPAPVEQAQAARGEARAADDSAMGREKELDAELMSGVSAARLAQIKAEKAEIAQARSLAGEQQVEADMAVDGVRQEAQAKVDQSVAERGFWADTIAALKRGYAGAAQSANILQGATDAENAQDIADYEKMKQANPASTEFQEFLNAKGFAESAAAFIKNPISIVSEVIAESAAQMVPSIALGFAGGSAGGALASAPTAGTAAPATVPIGAVVGSAIGAGTGSYLAEYGNAMLQSMQEAGMDAADPKSIQAFFGDEQKLAAAKEFAVKRGIPIAIFDAVSMGLAGKFMKPVQVAAKGGAKVTAGQVLKASGKELAAQAAAGAGGEAAAQLASTGEISEGKAIFLEGIAEVGFAPLEVASNLREFGGAAPGSKEADLMEQTTTALTAIDPEAAPPTPQEIGNAAFITGQGAGVEGLAESVVIERELAGIDAEDTAAVAAADQAVLDAKATGDAATIKAAETARESVIGGRAHLVRAVLKIASGRDISTLTDNELRSIGYKADKEKPGEYVELDADEAKAAGITKPMVRRGADESVVITDEALKRVEGILPRARARVKMGETEALDKAQQRANTPEWEVDTSAGPVRVKATSPEDAERIAAETSPLGQTVRPGSAKQVSPSPGSDSGNAPGGASPVNPAAGNQSSNETGQPQTPPGAANQQTGSAGNPAGASGGTASNAGGAQGAAGQGNAVPGAGKWSIVDSDGNYKSTYDTQKDAEAAAEYLNGADKSGKTYSVRPATAEESGGASSTGGKAAPGTKALAAARKRIEQIKSKNKRLADAIIETQDPSMWAMMSEDGKSIYLNVERIIKRALEIGMSEAQAAQYFARVLDEEIRHMAHNDSARNQYAKIAKEAGIHFDEKAFENWREQHYGEIWQNDFVAPGKDKIIRDLYSRDTTKGKTHNFDSLPAWKKAFEGIRALSQGDKVTEGSKLWTNIRDTLRQAIEAALAALKEFIDIASPTLKTEIQNLENALKQLNKPRGGTSKAGGKKPASGQAGAGTGGAAPQGGDSSPDSNGGTQPPPSDGAGAPLSVGARVSFVSSSPVLGDMAGQRIEGTIAILQNGMARVRPDFDPSISVAVPVDELTVEQAAKPQAKPASNEVGRNKNGDQIFTDANGVRYLEENGFRINQPVDMRPTRDGVESVPVSPQEMFDRGNLRFLTETEVEQMRAAKAAGGKDTEWEVANMELLSEDRARINAALVGDESVVNAIRNSDPQNARIQITSRVRAILAKWLNAREIDPKSYTYFSRMADNPVWIDSVFKSVGKEISAGTPQQTPTPPTNEKEGQGQGQAEGQMLTPPPSGDKSPAALTPEEEQAKKDLFDAFDGLVDGLEAAPLPEPEFYRERPPTDRLPQMQKAAQSLISAGVDTPGKLAEFLEKVAPNKLRQFSEFLWRQVNSFLMGDTAAVDWNEIYNASTNQDATIKVGDWVRFKDRPDEGPWTVWSKDGDRVKLDNSTRNLSFNIDNFEKVDPPQGQEEDADLRDSILGPPMDAPAEVVLDRLKKRLLKHAEGGNMDPHQIAGTWFEIFWNFNGDGYATIQGRGHKVSAKISDILKGKIGVQDSTNEESAPEPAAAYRLASQLAERIKRKEKTSIQELTRMASEVYGGRTGEGFDIKTAYDSVEMAINILIGESGMEVNVTPEQARQNLETIRGWLEYIPTQTRRTGEMDAMQQFSTPPHFSYIASWVAAVGNKDVGFEPSAGLGGLAAWMARAGADVRLNELSPRRREMLDQMHIGPPATGHDAGVLHSLLLPAINNGSMPQPTIVVMNPPFSNNAAGRKDLLTGAKHIDEALKLLPPGGRLVAIVGEGMALEAPKYKPWWDRIRRDYNVRANIHVDGREYAKYGTTFSNRILVIDKVPPTGESIVGGEVTRIEDLIPLLDPVRTTRPTPNENAAIPGNPSPPNQQGGIAPTPQGGNGPRGTPRTPGSRTGSGSAGQGGSGGLGSGNSTNSGGQVNGGSNATDSGSDNTGTNPDGQPSGRGGQDSSGTAAKLDTEVERDEASAERNVDENEVFTDYTPTKFRLKGSQPHPTTLVESSAMATTELPASTVTLNLPKEVVTSGELSDAQLEAIAYAVQAHESVFENGERQGFFIGDGTGVGKGREIAGTILHNWREGRRKAVWITEKKDLVKDARRDFDGIGGKDVSVYDMAKNVPAPQGDAVAFLTYDGLKGNFDGLTPDGGIRKSDAKKPARIQNLLNWLGADFDGLIALDEVHNAGNALAIRGSRGTKQPSQKAIAVVELQKVFPKARFLYVSATGATEPNNLAFASRLGMWGPGKAFRDAVNFYNQIKSAGISAMEIVARDLKAMGLYVARTLSFKGQDGGESVTFTRLEHSLTPDQETIYGKAAEAWQTIFANIDRALAVTGAANSSRARNAAASAFWGSQQRFFNGLLTAMQMPSAIADMKQKLDEGGSIVIQLINTNEEALNRAIARALAENPTNPDYENVDLSSRQDILEFIHSSYPVNQYVEVPNGVDSQGNPKTQWVLLTDEEGNAIPNPQAVAMRDALLDEMARLPLPDPPLEQIIRTFGAEAVAEITGRDRRLIEKTDDRGSTRRVVERRNDSKREKEKNDFLDGKRRILMFSDKGGTGFSYHAGANFKNQQKRYQYVVQAGWRADKAIQGLGRTHRADQVKTPAFILVSTNVSGHKRFISTIARRLQQLGALTSGERKTTGQGLFDDSDNIEDAYGDSAVTRFFFDLFRGEIPGLGFDDITRKLGFQKTTIDPITGEEVTINKLLDDAGLLNTSKIPELSQFLNRILALPIQEQNSVFDAFMERREVFIRAAKESGSYDAGVETFNADEPEVVADEAVYQDPNSSAATRLVEIKFKRFFSYNDFDFVTSLAKNPKYVVSRDGKRVYALGQTDLNVTMDDGRVLPGFKRFTLKNVSIEPKENYTTGPRPGKAKVGDQFTHNGTQWELIEIDSENGKARIREVGVDREKQAMPTGELRSLYEQTGNVVDGVNENSHYVPDYFELDQAEAQSEWNRLLAAEPKFEEKNATFIVGSTLPIWHRIPFANKQVKRVKMDDGSSFLGMLVPEDKVDDTRAQLGASASEVTPAKARAAIIERGARVELSNGWVMKRTNSAGEQRIEVVGVDHTQWGTGTEPAWNRYGYIERINFAPRYFLRTDLDSIDKLLRYAPAVQIVEGLQAAELPALRADSPEWKSMSKAQRAEYLKKKGGLEAAPLPETDANIGRLRSKIQGGMNKPLLDEARRQQAAFGNISTPRLANPGNTERSRAEQDIVDALYEHERQVRKDRDVFAEARRRVNDDPKGVEEKLLQIAEGKTFATDDADHVAFAMLINQRAAEAGNDLTKHEANMALRMAYRAMRADTARELRIGYDKFMKPEERARKAIADAIYTPTLAIEKRAAQLNFSPEKQREYIRQAASERLQTIEKALKKMGVTLDEILSGQAFLSLSQNAILKQALAVRTAEERMVVKMLQAKTPLERIKKKTGFTEERIEGIRAMLYEELLEKAKEKVRAGMKLENFKDAMKGLQAAPLPGAGLTEEQIEAEARRIVEIGFGIPRETPKASVAKPKRIKPKADTDPHQADWTRPVFTDGLNDYDFDTKDRAEIMKRVEAIRGIASATGKINTLTGKKKAQAEALLKEIDAILAKYGTDSEKIFEAAKPVEEYAFNIHDRAHVAAIARAIQAIDADIVDKGLEWVYSSILSGIQTMTVNATAAIPAAWDMTVGRGFEMAVNALFRDKSSSTPNEVKYILKAARPALARAMSNASATWGSELPMFDEDFLGKAADLDKLFDGHAPKIGVIGGTKGRIIRVPLRILLATDEFNRTAIAVAEVGAMAYRVAQAQGLKPGTPEFDKFLAKEVNTAGSYSAKLAAEKASKLIFTNPLPGQTNPITDERAPIEGIGDVVGAGAALLNSLVTTKTDNLFAKALLAILRVSFFPFQRTPFNLIRRGVRHTLNPISLIDIAVLMTKNSITVDTNGKIRWKWNARGRNPEIVVRLAQQLQGATLLAALMSMAAGEGDEDDQDKPILITGSQPFTLKGMAEREAQMRSGLGPYRISFRRKDGSERFGFNYGRLEPLATTLGTTIDSLKAYKRTNRAGADGAGVASSVLGGLVAQAQDKTYLQGFADLFSLVNNALESDESLKDNRKFQQFMASRVAMAFPNIIKQPIRETDPMYRARAEDFMQELLYQAAPYGQKEAKADPYGRLAEKTGNPVGRVFDVTDAGTDPVNPYDKALLRWRDSGQGKPWFPAPIVNGSFKNNRTGKEQDMTQDQLAEFRNIAGKRVTAMLKREAINLESPTIIDIEKIKDAHSKARSEAKKMIAYKHSR